MVSLANSLRFYSLQVGWLQCSVYVACYLAKVIKLWYFHIEIGELDLDTQHLHIALHIIELGGFITVN